MRYFMDFILGFFFQNLLFKIKSVFLLKEGVVFGSCLIEQFHPTLDVLFNLNFLFLKLLFQQLRTILNEHVSIEKIGLASMRDINDFQSPFYLPLVVAALSKSSCTADILAISCESWLAVFPFAQFVFLLPLF